VLRAMINFAIVRFEREVVFTAHDANLLITVLEISYGQVGSFPDKRLVLLFCLDLFL